ncbi:MAG: hypothetical protein KDC03_10625 [Flavobacteriales bacterium]|nr:hypothetical protein [Flavobacteriales bacterium]
MERVVRITDRKGDDGSRAYWSERTPQERLEALEMLRAWYLKEDHVQQRLQRVCRIAQRARR